MKFVFVVLFALFPLTLLMLAVIPIDNAVILLVPFLFVLVEVNSFARRESLRREAQLREKA